MVKPTTSEAGQIQPDFEVKATQSDADAGRADPLGRWSPPKDMHVPAWGAVRLPRTPARSFSRLRAFALLEKNDDAFFAGCSIRFKKADTQSPELRRAPRAWKK